MVFLTHWPTHWTAALVNHLWQSTVFAAGAWLLTIVLRRNQAATRYQLWMLASAKFLIPFSLLIAAGGRLHVRTATTVAQPGFSILMEDIAEPYSSNPGTAKADLAVSQVPSSVATTSMAMNHYADWLPLLLMGVWGAGSLFLLIRWTVRWWQIRTAVRAAIPLELPIGVPVLSTSKNLEPGIFGIRRPVLLLPQGITERLNPRQLDAILAHELCHVRRRDNLTAALHMIVEAVFWFHPLVWWIRTGLIEERERACDEAVLDSQREALDYAEGILNVCKFYVEAPLSCVSGVTGSDLKKRIVRIMAEQVARKLDLSRKLILSIAGVLAVGTPVAFGLVHAAQAAAAQKTGIDDTWQGTLHVPQKDLRTVLKITKAPTGDLKAAMYSIDQGGQPAPTSTISFQDGVLKYSVQMFDITYEGKLSADGKSITGSLKQGSNPMPLVFERATPETAWAIPEPPPKMAPMAADANPGIEVATIKPSKPDQPGKIFTVRNGNFVTINTTLTDLITFAFDVQQKQIVGGEPWMSTDKFDLNVKPDIPGMPSGKQLKAIIQKLLADRFQLKFHHDKKEMSAYLLGVGKNGTKMKKNEDNPNGLPGLFFRGLGVLTVTNATMAEFSNLMQSAVLDRPVVDQTALQGRYDFLLKWTPDESQFGGMGIKVPPPSDAADSPPSLFTAIQEQIGLKLDAGKAQVDVISIDHVAKPSEN